MRGMKGRKLMIFCGLHDLDQFPTVASICITQNSYCLKAVMSILLIVPSRFLIKVSSSPTPPRAESLDEISHTCQNSTLRPRPW